MSEMERDVELVEMLLGENGRVRIVAENEMHERLQDEVQAALGDVLEDYDKAKERLREIQEENISLNKKIKKVTKILDE